MSEQPNVEPIDRPPGTVVPWREKLRELPQPLPGDEKLSERIWQDVDAPAYTYIWHCLVSF